MRGTITAFALATSILSANALQLRQTRDGEAPRVVQHEIRRRHVPDPVQHDRNRLRKRQSGGTLEVKLTNEETLYFMSMSVGTPAQDVKMHIDTGSSDMWVNVANSRICQSRGDPCGDAGTYSANSSSTYQYLNSDFNITYVDGTASYGDYATDTVSFAGVSLENQQFGVGYESSSQEGIVGIGYPINEVAVSYGYNPYPNIPVSLVQNGHINTNAYSLWLNDLDANTGSILFGGVNSGKYTGELQTLPIIPLGGNTYAYFTIALTAVGANGKSNSITSNGRISALLDSGSSLMYLPNDITQSIYNAVGAQYDSNQGYAYVPCSLADRGETIDFTFSSPTIQVSMSELVLVAGVENGSPVCILGIAPSGSDNTAVLGDTFIRSAYIVYDLANNEISMAQTNFNSTSDNIQEITKGSSIPSATAVQSAVTSVAQVSDGARVVDLSSFSSSSGAAAPTAAVGYNLALLGAAGAAVFAL